ncbi:chromosomal replication initiator protein DnaA [Candidatus Woesebacteria bacterium]|nr:MAG: chromosomal replication initiator protein DnaA [Candidatus Woesebacteria bacterium]
MSGINKTQIWNDSMESIKISVSPAIFSTWFSQTHLSSLNKKKGRYVAKIGCSSSFVKSTIEGRYFGLIQDSLKKILDTDCDLIFIVKEDPKEKGATKIDAPAPLFEQEERLQEEIGVNLSKARIRPGFTFENYAVSSSNQMAWAAAEAVSKNPGSSYNPLFIWGGVGVGKTHLMNAVGHHLIGEGIDGKVLFCTGEEFTNEIVEGIRKKTTMEFRNKYRKLKILIIDDIQFIAGKDAVQEEFFHTFNALVSEGGQVILASDQPPHEISKLEERLRSRFEAGLIVDISPPDFELRCAIVQIKTKERGIEIPMDLVQLIAGNINSARKMEGFLIRLSSEAKLKNTEITEELIRSLLGKGIESNDQKIKATPSEVITAVSKYFSLGKRALLGTSRARPVSLPRQILMYLLRTQLNLPLQEVGRLVGGRDHTTVMHAVEKITHLASRDVQIRQDILGIKNNL